MENNNMQQNDKHPFWDFMMNLGIVRWFCNLGICKKCMQIKIFQVVFNYEMITYIFYGVVTTLLNLVIFYGCKPPLEASLGNIVGVAVANVIAWVLAMLFAFFTNKLIVFRSRDMSFGIIMKELVEFAIARLLSLGAEEIILIGAAAIFRTDLATNIAKIIAQVVVVIMNYVFSKLFIFKKKKSEGEEK